MKDKISVDLGLKDRLRFELALQIEGRSGDLSANAKELILNYTENVLTRAIQSRSDEPPRIVQKAGPSIEYNRDYDLSPFARIQVLETKEEYLTRMERKISKWADPDRKKKPIPYYILRAFLLARRLFDTDTPTKKDVQLLFVKEYLTPFLDGLEDRHQYDNRMGEAYDKLDNIFIHNLAQMKRPDKQAHGKIFQEKGRTLVLEPDIANFVMQNYDDFLWKPDSDPM